MYSLINSNNLNSSNFNIVEIAFNLISQNVDILSRFNRDKFYFDSLFSNNTGYDFSNILELFKAKSYYYNDIIKRYYNIKADYYLSNIDYIQAFEYYYKSEKYEYCLNVS